MCAADLVAYLPCPIKVPFEQAIEQYLASQGSPPIACQLEGNANKNEEDYQAFLRADGPDGLPPLLITPGVNQLFGQKFVTNVLDSGNFGDVADYPLDSSRSESNLRDPQRHATVLAANVTVIVVDHTHLGSRQAPERWTDLLSPEFERSIVMRGNGKTFCETTLLAWQQLFGNEGLRRMGRSIREGKHPAQMAKVAGTGQCDGAAAYVMPYFFARNIRNQDKVSLIWPKEGVIASPVTLLAKRQLSPELQAFAQWLAGSTIARLFSLAGLPTPHPSVSSGLPVTCNYLWPGWNRTRTQDLSAALLTAEEAFESGHRWSVE